MDQMAAATTPTAAVADDDDDLYVRLGQYLPPNRRKSRAMLDMFVSILERKYRLEMMVLKLTAGRRRLNRRSLIGPSTR